MWSALQVRLADTARCGRQLVSANSGGGYEQQQLPFACCSSQMCKQVQTCFLVPNSLLTLSSTEC